MNDPRSLILRIYRRSSGRVSGVAEDPQTGTRRAFSSARELWELVASQDALPHAESATDVASNNQSKERKK
jgi:hypothetical protein